MGMPEENIFIGENGAVIEFDDDKVIAEETVTSGNVLVDGLGVGDVGNIVLRDRRHLSQDGLMAVILTIDPEKKVLLTEPEVVSRGFIYVRDSEDMMVYVKKIAREVFETPDDAKKRGDWNIKRTLIRDAIHEYVYENTKRNPMILPIVVEVNMQET